VLISTPSIKALGRKDATLARTVLRLIVSSQNGRQVGNPRTLIPHNGDETLGDTSIGSRSALSKQKLCRGLACIAKGVVGYLGHGGRNSNLLLPIKTQGGANRPCPVTAEHHILLLADWH
jgi:hypothetical protein